MENGMDPLNQLLADTRVAARDAVMVYFRPLLARSVWPGTGTSGHQGRRAKAILGLLKRAICFNQGAIIEYGSLIAHKHEELKEAFIADKNDVEQLKRISVDMLNFMNRKLFESVYFNFEFIREYFDMKRSSAPRICLKGNFVVNSHDKVVSIFRDQPVKYYSDVHIDGNSGFRSIKENGRYFFENNMPEATVERGYVNPRLKADAVKADFKRVGKLETIIRNWDRYWVEYDPSKRGDSSFYKSTLIVPLTLWNNEVSEEFENAMNLRMAGEKIERYIFGYLCLDHRDVDYFDEEHDAALGYIFADMLSIFVFTRKMYTEASRTFTRIQEVLQARGVHLELENVGNHLPRFAEERLLDQMMPGERIESSRNKLVPTDEVLLTYAQTSKEIVPDK
jgi:hypothetical protein